MNSFLENWGPDSFDSSLWYLAGWTMCYFLVAGTAIGLAGALLRFLCHRAAPTLRYAISLTTFATLTLLPIAIAAWLIPPAPTAIDLQTPYIAPPSGWETPAPPKQNTTLLPSHIAAESSRPEGGAIYAYSDDGAMVIVRQVIVHLPWFWIFGAPITFALLATGLVGSTRMRRNCEPITTGVLADSCNRLRKSLNVTRRVSMALCDRIAQPVLVGIVRPLILLPPAALTGWSPDELEMVLLHELAHVRRWDNLVNLLQRIVESLLFFHPAVWLVSRQVRRDREECCDAVVVAHTAKPQAYAELLVNIAAATPPPLAGLALARHPLTQRIRRILKLEDEPMLVSRNTLGAFTLATLTLVAVVLWQPTTASIAEEPDTSVASEGITTEDTEGTEEEGITVDYEFVRPKKVFSDPKAGRIWHATQIAIIKSRFVLNNAIRRNNLLATSLLRTKENPVDWLHSHLDVQITPHGIRLELAVKSKNQKEISRILQAIEASYKEELQRENSNRAEEPETLGITAKSAKAAPPAIPVFLSLEQQRLVDLVRKTLDVELEQLGVEGLARVKASKFEGGLRLTTSTNDGGFATGDPLYAGDILVGLHVWPTKSLEDVAKILQRDDIAELSPLKFFVIRRQPTNQRRVIGGSEVVEVEMVDKLTTGRIAVNFDALKGKPQMQETAPTVSPTPQDEPANPTLYYDGKTFEEWRRMWKTELKTEKRTECISALAAFGRAGRGKEAVEAILDVAGEYDFLTIESNSVEGKFKNRVLELLPKNFPSSLWFSSLMERYDSDAKKWEHLAMYLFIRLDAGDEKIRQRLLDIANSDHSLRLHATRALIRWDANLKHPETVKLARKALQGEHPDMAVLYQLRYQHLDQVPEQFDMLLHEDPEIRKSARRIFINNNRIQPLIDKLMKVLDDSAQSKKHVYAIRALSYANGNPKVESRLAKIVREGDEQLLGPALFSLTKVMGAPVDAILRMIGEDGLSEDRRKLLSDTKAIEKLVDQEKQLVEQDNYGSGGGGGFGGGGGGGGFF